jgi:hypothetical protein
MTFPVVIELLDALRSLGLIVARAKKAIPRGALRELLGTLELLRKDILEEIVRTSTPNSNALINSLLAERERFAGKVPDER